ncbi:hypothetical protein SAMN05421766_103728 [Zobellia uliginosa]|uniref:Uncharacterized protein n=1 Tax=Zobellia uliginosa TaxID=143224 RepID=A0ABY1KT57_9FLAO|nr:hypothetical protein SAMN05421766_103728 [Zobellia uliginosa]
MNNIKVRNILCDIDTNNDARAQNHCKKTKGLLIFVEESTTPQAAFRYSFL